MTCDERQDLLLLYAADALDADERDALDEHLSAGCPRCVGALAEARATVAHLPLGLAPLIEPPAGARDRLMQHALADASAKSGAADAAPAKPAAAASPWGPWLTFGAAAAVVLLVVGLTFRTITNNYQQRLAELEAANRDLASDLKLRDATMSDLQLALARATRDAQVLNASELQLVALDRQEPQPGQARGRILWDRERNEWHLRVFDMKPPPPGKTYELWFITPDQRKVPAGTFDVDAGGEGSHVVKVPPDLGPIALAAVTDEPLGGVDQPTGSIQLVGAVQ